MIAANPNQIPEQSVAEVQKTITQGFQCFDDWTMRYEYLIDLGRKMPSLPNDKRTEENRLHGCLAQVWLVADVVGGRLFFRAASDSAIVSGLIALLIKVYSGRTPEEILTNPPEFISKIGLEQHLSQNRANGLSHMLARIRALALAHQPAPS